MEEGSGCQWNLKEPNGLSDTLFIEWGSRDDEGFGLQDYKIIHWDYGCSQLVAEAELDLLCKLILFGSN